GRAPIEAVAKDIKLSPQDWVFRCNLVTIANEKMADHSAGHISTNEAEKLIQQLQQSLADPALRFYTGLSYRHLCVISGIDFNVTTEPPHDIIGQKTSKYLPHGKNADILTNIMAKSQQLFENHEINRVRRDLGENPVTSVWLWGHGQKAAMESFFKRFGLKGVAITAVDLVRGLAKLIRFDLITVEGATGYFDTNYKGKADAAIQALKDYDIVLIHVEAPDEAGHSGNALQKKQAVEAIDKHIVGPVHNELKQYESYRILVMPDHPTPVATQAHSSEPVPFAMAGNGISGNLNKPFSEENAIQTGFRIEKGHELMEYFIKI
ncbi:MAG: 2,3-bisphosphoglycerate-independent phosphoglycerate mutase, partial [Deltaproteobacteria bacterium]|nr:2,3-bisphosphoglycerate-independent phosphoglycerate mutase [Deltaproteobacteria bacterium]